MPPLSQQHVASPGPEHHALPQVTVLALSAPLFTMSLGLFTVLSTLTLQGAALEKLPWLPGGVSGACQPLAPYRTLVQQDPTCLVAHVVGRALLHSQAVSLSKTIRRRMGYAGGYCAQVLSSH